MEEQRQAGGALVRHRGERSGTQINLGKDSKVGGLPTGVQSFCLSVDLNLLPA